MSRQLEAAMNVGNPVIFEDANETFDPMLDPLLAKQLKKEGSEWFIKFGDGGLVPFSSEFQFYITTKMSRPHYSPEICVKVTMVNFMVTPDGLLDQITSKIVEIEAPSKAAQREQCITQKADSDRTMIDL